MEVPIKVIEYTTELSPGGHFTLPLAMLQDIDLRQPKRVRVLIIYEEAPPKKTLAHFGGRWQDQRSADEIVAALYAERKQNTQTDAMQW